MESVNKVELLGIIGNIKEFDNLYHFSLCTTAGYGSKGEFIMENTWHNIQVLKSNVIGTLESKKWAHVDGRISIIHHVTPENEERTSCCIKASKVEVKNNV